MAHILLPSDVYPPKCGGAGWSAHALALALMQRNHRVQVIVPREGGRAQTARSLERVPVVEVGYHTLKVPFLRNYFRHERLWPRLAGAIIAACKSADAQAATLIHAQHVQAVPAALLAARSLGLPVVATVRDHWPWDYFATGLHGDRIPYPQQTSASLATDLVGRLGPVRGTIALPAVPYLLAHTRRRAAALAACDAVIAVSRYIAQRLEGIVAPERLHVIPNMVDVAATDQALAQPSRLVPEAPFLLFVGKLERNKGVRYLPAIIAAAHAALPDGHPALERIVLAGSGGLRPWLERELGSIGVQPIFVDWAPHDDVLRLMSRCAALLFPSDWGEPLSRVLLEALACGAPIVAMPTGGTPDLIEDGVSGLLAATPSLFGQRLATLLVNDPLRRQLATAARQRSTKRFATDIVAPQVEQLYARLLMIFRN